MIEKFIKRFRQINDSVSIELKSMESEKNCSTFESEHNNQNQSSNRVCFDDWFIEQKIGEDTYDVVYKIKKEYFNFTDYAAMKVISIPRSNYEIDYMLEENKLHIESIKKYYEDTVNEIIKGYRLLIGLGGISNIVNIQDMLIKKKYEGIGWDIFIRTELLTPLEKRIAENGITKTDVVRLGIDICRALEAYFNKKIIHRDIKPSNIFYSEIIGYKLDNSEIACSFDEDMNSRMGTLNYMAPEVYRGETYDFRVDIYSLGITMYRLLNNNRGPFLPIYSQKVCVADAEEALKRRLSGEELPKPREADDKLAEVILKACAFYSHDRYESPLLMRHDLENILYNFENDDADREYNYFLPYEGMEPYIFISYSHLDKDIVIPIIKRMIQLGCRIWYDEGINPGKEWPEIVAQHVDDSKLMIAFLSKNYLKSSNCKDELDYARDLGKERILVYLEDITLPSGMAMRLNRLQAVKWYSLENKNNIHKILQRSSVFVECLDSTYGENTIYGADYNRI